MRTLPAVYGGYSSDGSIFVLRTWTARRWLNVSKPNLPWYAPMPLSPTPPNGKCGLLMCMSVPFTHAPPLVAPGGSTTYRLHASTEGTFLFYNQAVTTGGEANTGSLAFGMFGAVTVQPAGAEWYRSQVSRADLDLATERDAGGAPALLPTGHPRIDYTAVFPQGHPQAGRPVGRGLRRSVVPRLPYLIIYRADEEGAAVLVVTIRHTARREEA